MIGNLRLGTRLNKFVSSLILVLLYTFQLCVAEQGFIPECSTDKGISIPEGYPTASTTGVVGAGISYSSLTPHSGTYTINGKNNTVIEGLDISGYMRIMNSSNLIIRNCRIISNGDLFSIRIESSNSMITIENCEIGTSTEGTATGITALGGGIDSLIIRNCDISGGADGMKVSNNNLIEGNYFHHLCRWYNPEDRNGLGDWTHNDCLQTLGADNVIIRGNTFLAPYQETNSTFQCQTDKGSISNITIEENYLSGGGNCLNIREKNSYTVTNIIIRNNLWEDNTFKYGPYVQITEEIPESYGNSFISGGECDIVTGKCVPNDAGKTISVSSVSLDKSSIELKIGENFELKESFSPSNATDKSVTWASDNPAIATVDANGIVTAISEGTTIITVTTNDGDFADKCTVIVGTSGVSLANIALNKPITVSNEHLPDDPKEELVDGDAVSYWAADGFPQWAEIDLQGTFDLSSIELITHKDRDYQYIVEAKTTGGTYTTIVDRSANAEGKNLVDAVTVTATHVKITVTGAKTYTGTWASLKELIVMGIPGSEPEPSSQQSAYASNALPGRIQVEDYDNGGEGIAFHDVDEKKLDLTLRPDDNVDMEATTDTDGEYNTGWMSDGEWLEYTLTDVAAGIYTISVRASSDKTNPGDVIIKLGDGPEGENFVTIATVPISGTGGWEKWQTFTANDISIDAGTNKVLRLQFDEAGYDMNWVDFSAEIIPVDITLDKETAQIVVGESLQLTETVLPSGAADKTIIWTTSDASVATVDANGVVSALSTGKATITSTTNTGGLSATCEITVVTDIVAVDGISISDETLELNIGATLEISVTITPEDASDKSVTWSSSDENIATVDANGTVSALSDGQATITVKSSNGDFTASCIVTVTPNIIAVESISISHTTAELTIDSTISLSVKIAPENASDKSVSWASSDPDVATVDENGLVTAVSEGAATITATTSSGGFTSDCKVEVLLPNGNIGINNLAQNSKAMAIYPNPNSTGILHIDLPSGCKVQNTIIKIYDLTGKTILEQYCPGQYIEIDLSFKRGIYVVEVSMPTETSYRKLIVR